LILLKLIKSSGAAALINNVLWILFFTIKTQYNFILFVLKNPAIYICIIIVITVVIIGLIIRYKNKLQRQKLFYCLSVFWLVIFIINAIPAFIYVMDYYSTHIDEKNYKSEFNVDNNLPSPNIYWLFMDGMLGFKAMEKLFNDPQIEFSSQLTERGFIINRDVQFEALHSTASSLPALMCPTYYDSILKPVLQSIDTADYNKKIKIQLNAGFNRLASLARTKNELISAFAWKGYQTCVIGYGIRSYCLVPDYIYLEEEKLVKGKTINVKNDHPESIINLVNLTTGVHLLFVTTPISKIAKIFNKLIHFEPMSIVVSSFQSISTSKSFRGELYQGYEKWHLDALADTMNYSGPKLVIIHDHSPHGPFIYGKYGDRIKRKKSTIYDPYNYPPQHYFASSAVISYIDFILNTDPEAVIVIQADHGLHYEETRQLFISKNGKEEDDIKLMQNQTISAVRIPEKYGGVEEPVEPLNISRILINRFVGNNYKLLVPDDIVR
jgi:hypothetical protein